MMKRIFKQIAGNLAKFDFILENFGILSTGLKFQRNAMAGQQL